MSEMEEDWALLRRTTPRAEKTEPVEDMSDDWRTIQGYNEFGYMVTGSYWRELAIWKVRILGPAGDVRGYGKGVKFEHVELVWHQEKADTRGCRTIKASNGVERTVRIFRTAESKIGSLQDACCCLGALRDKARSGSLDYRTQLHETIRKAQEELSSVTKRIAEMDSFVPTSVVPGDLLEAELQEEDRILSEMRAEG